MPVMLVRKSLKVEKLMVLAFDHQCPVCVLTYITHNKAQFTNQNPGKGGRWHLVLQEAGTAIRSQSDISMVLPAGLTCEHAGCGAEVLPEPHRPQHAWLAVHAGRGAVAHLRGRPAREGGYKEVGTG